MEIPSSVEPGPIVEMDHIDNEGIPLPAAARVPHPPLDWPLRMRIPVHINVANGVLILVQDGDFVGLLNDLKRMRHVRDARNSRKVALGFRIERRAIVEVRLLSGQGRGLIRDRSFHDTAPGGHTEARTVILEIPGSRVEHLPNALQVRLPIRRARRRVCRRRRGLPHRGGRREQADHGQAEAQPDGPAPHRRPPFQLLCTGLGTL